VRSYRTLQLDFSTHSIGGLTDNDFIMAARVNALRRQA
jgi:pterin-4a-carbinolamine dehydratase